MHLRETEKTPYWWVSCKTAPSLWAKKKKSENMPPSVQINEKGVAPLG